MRYLLSATLLFICLSTYAQLSGKVVAISDGDTFWVLNEKNERIRVRLHGIDCPEKSQAYGTVAKNFLSDLIYNKHVELKHLDTDQYSRPIVIATVDSVNVNEALIKAGLAWHYKRYDKNKKWAQLESEAKKKKVGLWVDENPTPPWDYRRMEKENK